MNFAHAHAPSQLITCYLAGAVHACRCMKYQAYFHGFFHLSSKSQEFKSNAFKESLSALQCFCYGCFAIPKIELHTYKVVDEIWQLI